MMAVLKENVKNMTVKRLDLFGFKSFADKTSIKFSEGINIIVGPNGCGKSNIVDAMLWVLGEQSAKSLRGTSMQDVIFQGTTTRKPINLAEVTLTFCNEKRFVPLDVSEIAITRRVHRNGDSEYFLNKRSCRLKDIVEILSSGIGKNAFAIIGQGKVDRLINESFESRRQMFEEVAGVFRFLEKRKDALKKLELTQANVDRLDDVYKEVVRQEKILKKQVDAFCEREKIELELCDVEKAVFHCKYQELFHKKNALLQEVETLAITESQKKEEIDEEEKIYKEEKELFKSLLDDVASAQKKEFQAKESLSLLKKELSILQERIQGNKSRHNYLEQDIAKVQKELQKTLQDSESLKKKNEKEKQKYEAQKKELESLESDVRSKEIEFQNYKTKQKELSKSFSELQRLSLTKQKQIHECTSSQHIVSTRTKERQDRIQFLHDKIKEKEIELGEQKKEIAHLRNTIDSEQKVLVHVDEEVKNLIDSIRTKKIHLEQVQKTYVECEARLHVLESLQKNHEGFTQGAKAILQEAKKETSPFFNSVISLADAMMLEEYDEIPQNLLALSRMYNSTLVITDEQKFDLVLQFVKAQKIQEFSALILSSFFQNEKVFDIFSNRDKIKNLLFDYFHRSVKEKRLITLSENLFADSLGVICFKTTDAPNLFLQKRTLNELKKKIESIRKEKEILVSELCQAEDKQKVQDQKKKEQEKLIRSYDMALFEKNVHLLQAQRVIDEATKEIQSSKKELEILETKGKDAQSLLKTLEKDLSSIEHSISEQEKIIEELEKDVQEKNVEFSKISDFFKERETALHELKHTISLDQHMLSSMKTKIDDLQNQENRFQKEKAALTDNKSSFIDAQKALEEKIKEVEIEYAQCEKIFADKSIEKMQRERKIEQLEKSHSDQMQHKFSFVEARAKKEQDLKHILEAFDALHLEIMNRYGMIPECTDERSFDILEKKKSELEKELKKLPPANPLAETEYEEICDREKQLKSQLSDISFSKNELLKIIEELEQESKSRFVETFEQVNSSFQKNFSILFNGGNAELVLSYKDEKKDIFESGIEILAKPPGKQMRSIQLLSGGEKCLTAIALLFAFFEYKPSPFCILDEVDAPLDEANVIRLGQLLKQFALKSQFLVITHNKQTMTLSDFMIGVSMQEKGISKILSIDFEREEKEVEVLA